MKVTKTIAAKPRRFGAVNMVIAAALCVWAAIILYPVYNSVLVSLVTLADYAKTPFMLFPKKIDFSSYYYIFTWKSLGFGFRTTTILLFVGVLYNLFLTVSLAYVLNKKIRGVKFASYLIVFTMFFQGGLIPFYMMMTKTLHLQDSLLSMILPYGVNILYLMIMRAFFAGIPAELEEAALIEGANEIVILFRIILPLSMPMLATVLLYYGVDRWNEWWNGMLFIQSVEKQPLQLVVRNMLVSSSVIASNVPGSASRSFFAEGLKMGTVVLTMLPVMCIYPFLQRYFVQGIMLGAVKS